MTTDAPAATDLVVLGSVAHAFNGYINILRGTPGAVHGMKINAGFEQRLTSDERSRHRALTNQVDMSDAVSVADVRRFGPELARLAKNTPAVATDLRLRRTWARIMGEAEAGIRLAELNATVLNRMGAARVVTTACATALFENGLDGASASDLDALGRGLESRGAPVLGRKLRHFGTTNGAA